MVIILLPCDSLAISRRFGGGGCFVLTLQCICKDSRERKEGCGGCGALYFTGVIICMKQLYIRMRIDMYVYVYVR